jgi:hypothetical protein
MARAILEGDFRNGVERDRAIDPLKGKSCSEWQLPRALPSMALYLTSFVAAKWS